MPAPDRLYPEYPIDFEARVRILRADEGGRQQPPRNGIRWDFSYAAVTPRQLHMMLYPDFFDPITGDSWRELPVPVNEWLHVRVSIVLEHMRPFHQARIRAGTSFYYCEGSRIVAEGTVTRILGLFETRP
ncbi:hypothetical protein ACFPAF_00770 [Hymenobacter endophyticus]|uniref:Translation elongation factor EFTu/EF1A C-terminal domain-containing protein n=1 Tax=Hymenobacter endophyticus TaxID=3076335 RepID=A0ABU3TC54_9BACT|nr:hypothetical protein [Hymenobacter endophyticus]MDU0368909.1 hypothetical protein [Hymenobacter endophyticus]